MGRFAVRNFNSIVFPTFFTLSTIELPGEVKNKANYIVSFIAAYVAMSLSYKKKLQ